MPWYDFRCPRCDTAVSLMLSMSECATRPFCDECGARTERDFKAEQSGEHHPGLWPMKSLALGVHPDQIPEATEHARSMGVPVEFAPDGRAIFTGKQHRKRYAEAVGYYDRNGGYSDPRRGLDDRRA